MSSAADVVGVGVVGVGVVGGGVAGIGVGVLVAIAFPYCQKYCIDVEGN